MIQTNSHNPSVSCQKTRGAVIWTHLLNEPLQTLFHAFVAIILYQELHATKSQITLFTMIKPLVALLSLYWSFAIAKRLQKVVSNIIITGILARLPFFFVPLFDSPWLLIASAAFYMTLSRGGMPAWMEIMKQNLPEQERSKIFSLSSGLSYLEGVLLGIGIGIVLDQHSHAWKWIFPLTAAIGMISIFFQLKVPEKTAPPKIQTPALSLKEAIFSPWREAKELLARRPDFRTFQWGYMLAGAGLMVTMPALPLFFVDYLKITYTELAIAVSVCKGLGFAFSSPFWSSCLNRFGIYRTSSLVSFSFALFPLILMLALFHSTYLYLAFFWYGISQGGSHLCWHLSGTIFAKDENSYPFSNINVLTVGVRALIAPPLGGLLCGYLGPFGTFFCCAFLCSWAGIKHAQAKPIPVSL